MNQYAVKQSLFLADLINEIMNIFKNKWGNWTDISADTINNKAYVLQAKRHINGKVKFRIAKQNGVWRGVLGFIDKLKDVTAKNNVV